VSEDLRGEIERGKSYDAFLKKKVEGLQEDMQRIEQMINNFNGTTLLGVTRDAIKDSFSDVTAHLQAVAKDLSQDRVPIMTPSLEEGLAVGEASGTAPSTQCKARVSTFDVIPFSEIKSQIDSNYCEIQTKTAKSIIERFGLGKQRKYVGMECQTEGRFVSMQDYDEMEQALFDKNKEAQALEKEIRDLKHGLLEKQDEISKFEKEKTWALT